MNQAHRRLCVTLPVVVLLCHVLQPGETQIRWRLVAFRDPKRGGKKEAAFNSSLWRVTSKEVRKEWIWKYRYSNIQQVQNVRCQRSLLGRTKKHQCAWNWKLAYVAFCIPLLYYRWFLRKSWIHVIVYFCTWKHFEKILFFPLKWQNGTKSKTVELLTKQQAINLLSLMISSIWKPNVLSISDLCVLSGLDVGWF